MIISNAEKNAFWEKAYLAAIAGLSARPNVPEGEVVSRAVVTADKALDAYVTRAARFTG
ncbi:hypothetical protein [Pseudomonas protegens]|uniref:hypothetical protein n=1 Tax=Pseudomonas protegens TaxID=380021 RepID=UPI00275C7939|nr:hypothetical protein [Pseudomonas protegens]MDP9514657.1 hypothetical protein [Pseudomonas protegens]